MSTINISIINIISIFALRLVSNLTRYNHDSTNEISKCFVYDIQFFYDKCSMKWFVEPPTYFFRHVVWADEIPLNVSASFRTHRLNNHFVPGYDSG